MRVAVGLAIVLAATRLGRAEPYEASGFVGIGVFTAQTELGNSWAPEQVPNTAPVVGGRLAWNALPSLARLGDLHLALAVEGELSIATSFTGGSSFAGDGGSPAGTRMSYFAPVFGWRAHGLLRLAGGHTLVPHLALGAGGETVASSSPFMSKETDPVVYWGPGAEIAVGHRLRVRIDLRHGVMAARDDGLTSTFEAQLGLAATFGQRMRPPRVVVPEPPHPPPDVDTDHDGIVDRLDHCPTEPETVNGVDDSDGCPEADPDGDGIVGAADKCPDAAEDFDHFEDDDGCPDADNDKDGIADAADACPNEAETFNAFEDADGCPDQVPDDVTLGLTTAGALKFEAGRARVTAAGRKTLAPLLAAMLAHPSIRITVTGRAANPKKADLIKRRAEAVKWYLVDQGVTEGRIWTAVGDPAKTDSLELTLRPQ